MITFDRGSDADSALVELEQTVPVLITHRFGTEIEAAVVRTSSPPEAMLTVDGVATVDPDVEIELPDPDASSPDAPDPGQPDPESPKPESPQPELPEPENPDPQLPDPEVPRPEIPDPEVPEPEVPGPELPEPEHPEPEVPDVNGIPWGLDRMDQRSLPLSGSYSSPAQGNGVVAYIVDSGINPHDDFGARLGRGADFVRDGRGTSDCTGHGTHVAGTVGGATLGAAGAVSLVPVRIFGCDGTASLHHFVEALDWIAVNHPAGKPGVINVSGGGGGSDATQVAIERMLAIGLTFVSAAGNAGESACGSAHGIGVVGAVVVGATTASDARAEFSNFGPCVDLFAPGDDVRSASHVSPSATTVHDGTSMAAPHVAGAAAVLLSMDPSMTPAEVESALLEEATATVQDGGAGSPNLLLHVDPRRVAAPPRTIATPPSDQVAVEGRTTTNTVQQIGLALTGGDPRALLGFGLVLLLSGAIAVTSGRRFAGPAIRTVSHRSVVAQPPLLELRPKSRH